MELIAKQIRPRDICTKEAFDQRRAHRRGDGRLHQRRAAPAGDGERGRESTLTLFDVAEIFKSTPYIADLKPGGRYVAKDMYEAGGIYMLMKTLLAEGLLYGDCLTVTGKTLGENIDQR